MQLFYIKNLMMKSITSNHSKAKPIRVVLIVLLLTLLLGRNTPSSASSESIPWMITERDQHTATLLPSGRLLIAGGLNNNGYPVKAELYDPATGEWSLTGDLNSARAYHTATLLPDGKVLVAGGFNGSLLGSAELYDPTTEEWQPTGNLNDARFHFTSTLLPDGTVLAVGGIDTSSPTPIPFPTAERYDPGTGTWNTTGSLTTARGFHTATLLRNRKVLVVGGNRLGIYLGSAEIYDPSNGNWSSAGFLNTARAFHTANLLPHGQVLIAGGTLL